MHFLGVDVGTTHVKTCLLDKDLRLVRTERAAHPLSDRPEIGPCFDPDELWRLVYSQIQSLVTGIDPQSVRAIGVTSMAEAGLPVDTAGQALAPIVPWNDMGSAAYGQVLLEQFGAYDLFCRTGIIYHPKYSATRMIQLRLEQPDVFRRMHRWLSVTDLVLNRLCGSFVMDESQACRTLLYNIREHRWDPELVAAAGMTGKLPEVIPIGGVAGRLLPEWAAALGLSSDVAVVSCGQDHLSAAIAVGDGQPGTVINSMGTSEVYFGLADSPKLDPQTFAACLNQGCFVDGRYYWIANIPGSGASVEWFRRLLSVQGDIGYDLFSQEDPCRPSDLLYFPYVNGSGSPHTDPDRKGLFYGITAHTSAPEMVQAIFEGIAFETRWIFDTLGPLGIPVDRIVSVGGGTRNHALMQAKSDIVGREFTINSLKEATGIGAALLAARAVGVVAGAAAETSASASASAVAEASASAAAEAAAESSPQHAKTHSHERIIRPAGEYRALYDNRFQAYRKLHGAITAFMTAEADIGRS